MGGKCGSWPRRINSLARVFGLPRDIDLDAVRARLTDNPDAFAWSRCIGLCRLCGLRDARPLAPHPAQYALGADG